MTWRFGAWRRVQVFGTVLAVVLAAGIAGPLGTAKAAPATPAAKKAVLLSWGQNALGQLGNGKTTDSDLPVTLKLPTGVRASQVRGGGNFAVALVIGHGVFAWGNNRSGQQGVGRVKGGVGHIASSHVPVQVDLRRFHPLNVCPDRQRKPSVGQAEHCGTRVLRIAAEEGMGGARLPFLGADPAVVVQALNLARRIGDKDAQARANDGLSRIQDPASGKQA